MDVVYVVVIAAFVALIERLVVGCARLGRPQ